MPCSRGNSSHLRNGVDVPETNALRLPRFVLLAVLILLAPVAGDEPASSSTDLDHLSLADLLDIKLQTGSFLELDTRRSPVSMTLIRRAQIEASGARDLSSLLETYVPGFLYTMNRFNGVVWGMRGVSNDRNSKFIVLVNGHKVNTEARDGFITETELGFLGDIERVEVLRGPAGLVYGAGAMAGIVNIVTRRVEETSVEVQAGAGTRTGSALDGRSFDARGFWYLPAGQQLAATAGWRSSEGIGPSALYGNQGTSSSLGSYGQTPGNWRGSVDWSQDGLRIYARATHQESSNGWIVSSADPSGMGGPPGLDLGSTTSLVDALGVDATWEHPLGDQSLKLDAAWDGVTQRKIASTGAVTSMGERRTTLGAVVLWRTLPRTQLATGVQERIDRIGDDLSGRNLHAGVAAHPEIRPTTYSNTAVFAEGFTEMTDLFSLDYGGRWDGHTRTFRYGGTWNGKLALVAMPAEHHTAKLIAQTSSNNGTADSYEHNYEQFDDRGTEHDGAYLADPTDTNSAVISNQVSSADLHRLRPERIFSLELTSRHEFGPLELAPALSYSEVQDLFAWSPSLSRTVNSGEYAFVEIDLEAHLELENWTFGANHAFQRPVATDPSRLADTFIVAGYDRTKPGWYRAVGTDAEGRTVYELVSNTTTAYTTNPVAGDVTPDGKSFFNLPANMTKAWADWRARPWLSLHTDLRVFWGMPGKRDLVASQQAQGIVLWDVDTDPMAKWNAGLQIASDRDWNPSLAGVRLGFLKAVKVSLHVYDILGEASDRGAIHTLRYDYGGRLGLSGVDVRTYDLKVEKTF
jgi:outer membrane receptor protein involved in Fe transport